VQWWILKELKSKKQPLKTSYLKNGAHDIETTKEKSIRLPIWEFNKTEIIEKTERIELREDTLSLFGVGT
jgi:hypothetical protein